VQHFEQRCIALAERGRGIGRLQELLHFLRREHVGKIPPLLWGLDLGGRIGCAGFVQTEETIESFERDQLTSDSAGGNPLLAAFRQVPSNIFTRQLLKCRGATCLSKSTEML